MIEQIKELSAKLQTEFFAECRVFNYGKIGVAKAWSNDDVAAEIPKPRHCPEHRRIEPFIDSADRRNRSSDVRPQRIRDAIYSAVAGDDVDRTGALHLNDRRELPAFKKRIAVEWQVVNPVDDKPVTGVKIRKPAIAAKVVAVLPDDSTSTEGIVVERF